MLPKDAARLLGSPLPDLIPLDGTAVFLLPSAMTSELRQGQEVCWTSELFSREVLHLRGEIFRWLSEDANQRSGNGLSGSKTRFFKTQNALFPKRAFSKRIRKARFARVRWAGWGAFVFRVLKLCFGRVLGTPLMPELRFGRPLWASQNAVLA